MSALALMPLLVFAVAAGLGFAASAAAHLSTRRHSAPPPRGFRPVVIEGGKARPPAAMRDAAP